MALGLSSDFADAGQNKLCVLADLFNAIGRCGELHHALTHGLADVMHVVYGVPHVRTDGVNHSTDFAG
ncbi:hypothetical protein D3C85_1640250 [compost metagenome]